VQTVLICSHLGHSLLSQHTAREFPHGERKSVWLRERERVGESCGTRCFRSLLCGEFPSAESVRTILALGIQKRGNITVNKEIKQIILNTCDELKLNG